MFGGNPKNKFDSLKFSNSDWSIVEGDESIHGLDTKAKFLYYRPKYLVSLVPTGNTKIVTLTKKQSFDAFKKTSPRTAKKMNFNSQQSKSNISETAEYSPCRVITYNSQNSILLKKLIVKMKLLIFWFTLLTD